MRKILFALTVIFTLQSQAESLRPSRSLVEMDIGGFYGAEERAVLKDNGFLEISKNFLLAGGSEDVVATHGDYVVARKRLAPSVFNLLKSQVAYLSDAKLDTWEADFICLIAVVGPGDDLYVRSGYDSRLGVADGNLRNVLSEKGCHVKFHAEPVDERTKEAAYFLKGMFKGLALQLKADANN